MRNLIFILSVLFFLGCKKEDNSFLVGNWKHFATVNKGLDSTDFKTYFNVESNGKYYFIQDNIVKENGLLYVQNGTIFFDAIRNASLHKVSNDTIIISNKDYYFRN